MGNSSLLEKEKRDFSHKYTSVEENIKGTRFAGASKKIGLICAFLIPLYAFFVMEYIHFGTLGGFLYYLKTFTGSAIFSLVILYSLYSVMWMVIKRGFVAALILLILSFTLAIGNYFKHSLTGDFVYPWDLLNQSGNISELLSFVKSGLPAEDILLILFGICYFMGLAGYPAI